MQNTPPFEDELKFFIQAGAANETAVLKTGIKVCASFTQLLNIFGSPFFDATENPMDEVNDHSAAWEFSDSLGNVYTLSDTIVGEKIETVAAMRDNESTQDWHISVSASDARPKKLFDLISSRLQESIRG